MLYINLSIDKSSSIFVMLWHQKFCGSMISLFKSRQLAGKGPSLRLKKTLIVGERIDIYALKTDLSEEAGLESSTSPKPDSSRWRCNADPECDRIMKSDCRAVTRLWIVERNLPRPHLRLPPPSPPLYKRLTHPYSGSTSNSGSFSCFGSLT